MVTFLAGVSRPIARNFLLGREQVGTVVVSTPAFIMNEL